MTSSNAERVRITGPGDVAAAVPHLLGFHPEDSLVVFCIKRPRLRIELTMRFDVSSGPPTDRLASEAAIRAQAAGSDEVMLICYPATPHPDLDVASRHDLPHADLLERTCAEMQERDITIQNAVVTVAGALTFATTSAAARARHCRRPRRTWPPCTRSVGRRCSPTARRWSRRWSRSAT
jgi:hypothetical protein